MERYGRRDLVVRGGRLVGAGAALALGLSPDSRAAGRLDQLDRALRGPLLRPGQAGYGAARRPWNARFDDVFLSLTGHAAEAPGDDEDDEPYEELAA